MRRILGVDPDLVIVIAARRAAHNRNRLAAILRLIQRDVRHVDDIGMIGIDRDAHEIPAAAGDARIAIGQRPGIAAIVRTIEPRLFPGIDQRVHALAIGRDGHAYAAPIAVGKTVAG